MPYFKQIKTCDTYDSQTDNLHFDYNGNTGGGQSFLGGSFVGNDGEIVSSQALKGETVSFKVEFKDQSGSEQTISLQSDSRTIYCIKTRAGSSSQTKLQIEGDGEKKVTPSLVMSALFMLPSPCGPRRSANLNASPIAGGNYWLRSMWLKFEEGTDSGCAFFIPRDFVFCGGRSKDSGEERFFLLDYERRLNDVIALSNSLSLFPEEARIALSYFIKLYTGGISFSYEECRSNADNLLRSLSAEYPLSFSGYSDPLPFINSLLESNGVTHTQRFPSVNEPHNLIYFGAPGTGKSYSLNKLAEEHFDKAHTRRVTFHPDYSYASFVGCYKPTMRQPEQKSNESLSENMGRAYVSYEFVPGPLVKSYVEAKTHPNENYLLIVEEINRANPAAVFGDVFQLLDRDGDGESEYDVDVPTDLGEYLWKEFLDASSCVDEAPGLYSLEENCDTRVQSMRLPSNLYIWATMNSADQGVFPMDTAFKRRWEFRYMGIDEGEAKIAGKVVRLGTRREPVEWNALRHAVNGLLKTGAHVNEDKLLGPFFLKKSALEDDDAFDEAFKSKVLLYLYEDAAKMKRPKVFRHPDFTYSEICAEYDSSADGVFVLDEPVPRVEDGAASDDEGNGQGAEE